MGAMTEPPGKAPVMVFAGYPNDMASFMQATVWKSNFGRPAPSTQRAFRSCVCAMAWRFRAIDATLSPWPRRLDGVEAHKGPRNISQIT